MGQPTNPPGGQQPQPPPPQWGGVPQISYRPQPEYRGPARHAHGGGYWLLVGWWWEPAKWLGRIALWVAFWPVGLWRSARHGRKTREARERRGYR